MEKHPAEPRRSAGVGLGKPTRMRRLCNKLLHKCRGATMSSCWTRSRTRRPVSGRYTKWSSRGGRATCSSSRSRPRLTCGMARPSRTSPQRCPTSPVPAPNAVSPKIRSLPTSTSAFMKPRVWESVWARSTAAIGTFANRYGVPRSFASRSLSPTRASSGSVNRHDGTCRPVVARWPPARLSRTTRKSSSPMCVNCGLPAQSPTAHTPAMVVRRCSSTFTYPRPSRSTPATSSPMPSVFGVRPVATSR